MAQAPRDQNSVTTLLGTSNADGATPVVVYVDPATHRLLTSSVASSFSTIGDGSKTVTTAGTRVQLASSTSCSQVTITANSTNTDLIVVGGSTVVAAVGSRRGVPLLAYASITLNISDLSLVYLDSVVNGEGVTYTYLA